MFNSDFVLDTAPYLYHFLLSFLWQSSLFLGGVYILTRVLKNRNPDLINRIWLSALLALPAIPLLSQFIPNLLDMSTLFHNPVTLNTEKLTWLSLEYINSDLRVLGIVDTSGNVESILSSPAFLVPIFYTIILFILVIQLIIGFFKLASWKESNIHITDPSIHKLFNDAAFSVGVKQKITLFENDRITVPLTFGMISPVVVFPSEIVRSASMEELKGIAIHELSHIKRNDTLAFSYASIVKILFFFQPLVWIAVRGMIHTAEEICDGEAITKSNTPLAYAKLLSRIAEQLPKRSFYMNTSPSFMSGKKNFVNRVKTILSFETKNSRPISRGYGLIIIAIFASFYGVAVSRPLQFDKPGIDYSPKDTHSSATNDEEQILQVVYNESKLDVQALKNKIHPLLFPIGDTQNIAVSNRFGDSIDPYSKKEVFHRGIDFRAPKGAAVYATADGIILKAQKDGEHGNRIIIEHADELETRYSHLDEILVKTGDKVEANQKIGTVGSTGRSTGPHLHYEIRYQGGPIDPLFVIQKGDFKKKLDTMEYHEKIVEDKDVDTLPEMVGGIKKLYEYMGEEKLYPEEARLKKVNGEVTLNFVVNETGSPIYVTVEKEEPKYYGFAKASITALKAMEFTPGVKDGKKVPVKMQQTFRFKLN